MYISNARTNRIKKKYETRFSKLRKTIQTNQEKQKKKENEVDEEAEEYLLENYSFSDNAPLKFKFQKVSTIVHPEYQGFTYTLNVSNNLGETILRGREVKIQSMDTLKKLKFKNLVLDSDIELDHSEFFFNSIDFEDCIFKNITVKKNSQNPPIDRIMFKSCEFSDKIDLWSSLNPAHTNKLIFDECFFKCSNCQVSKLLILRSTCQFLKFKNSFIENIFSCSDWCEKQLLFLYCIIDSKLENRDQFILTNSEERPEKRFSEIEINFRGSKFSDDFIKSMEQGADFFHRFRKYFIEVNDFVQANKFYVLEERAKNWEIKKRTSGLWENIKYYSSWSHLYQLFSNFGSSILRPVVSFFGVTLLTSIILWKYNVYSDYGKALLVSLQHLLKPFIPLENLKVEPAYLIVIVVISNILQAIFLILFLIALRRRFQVKG